MNYRRCLLPVWTLAISLGAQMNPAYAQAPAPAPVADDPLFGTWVLDRAKSRFFDGEPLREQIRIFVPHEEGVWAKVVTIDHDGVATITEYVAAHDGVEYPFSGTATADAVTLTREGPYVGVTTFRHAGVAIGDARREITRDGTEMRVTITLRGNVTRSAVFRKVH